MQRRFERIVVGGGAMGLATTWHLARRGVRVAMLERFAPGHARGASHGATRNMNNAYAESHFLDLYDASLGLYRQLEQLSGRPLLSLTGLVTHGDADRVGRAHAALRDRGAATELIPSSEAERRWPGLRFENDVLVNRDAGRIDAAATLEVLAELSARHGAELRYGHRAVAIEPVDAGVSVRVETPQGDTVELLADGAVVAAGAWTGPLLRDLVVLPPLTVTEEHPAHFAVREEFAHAGWPSFNHFPSAAGAHPPVYGMLTPGEGMKVGFHGVGAVVDPDERPFRASDAARAALREHVAEWFPGLDPDSGAEISCTYTSTPSERFVLDRAGSITVGAGFSGQGFKFVPAIGEVLADASFGLAPPAAFALDSHRD